MWSGGGRQAVSCSRPRTNAQLVALPPSPNCTNAQLVATDRKAGADHDAVPHGRNRGWSLGRTGRPVPLLPPGAGRTGGHCAVSEYPPPPLSQRSIRPLRAPPCRCRRGCPLRPERLAARCRCSGDAGLDCAGKPEEARPGPETPRGRRGAGRGWRGGGSPMRIESSGALSILGGSPPPGYLWSPPPGPLCCAPPAPPLRGVSHIPARLGSARQPRAGCVLQGWAALLV
jgi:hypothetical protein